MIDHVAWLHLSDFHFVADGDEFSQREATRALRDDVVARVAQGPPISFVLVTGDIAFSGRPEEYERAGQFLVELAHDIGMSAASFFFVPGNHDVDRVRQRLAFEGACQVVTSQAAVDRILGRPEEISALIERQAAFWAFVSDFAADQERVHTADGLGYAAPIVVGGLKIGLMGLNSAWLSGREAEEMRLLIGERQMINALDLVADWRPQLQIAMAHHPVAWLHEWDQVSCHKRLLPEVDFYHRGHLHQEDVSLASSPERPCLAIAAGSSHATRFYANSYNVVELDLGAGTCTVRPFRYSPNAGRFERAPAVGAQVLLRGSLPGTASDIAALLAAMVPASASYSGYMAALITGQQAEIPIRTQGYVEFLMPGAARALIPAAELVATTQFLRLKNLLRLYDQDVSLSERVKNHLSEVAAFTEYLTELSALSEATRDDLVARHASALRVAGVSSASRRPHAIDYLSDLRASGYWEELELQARRYARGNDPELARIARVGLIEALMRSDERSKREEAVGLALDLLDREDVSVGDYLLAAGSAELLTDDATAIELTRRALRTWPDQEELRRYARGLASRCGDMGLRAEIEASRTRRHD